MIKIIRIILVFLFIQYLFYAHEGATHQYIVVEAYKLLEKQVGPIPELKYYIGTTHGRGNIQFQSPYVVGGAWAEDQEDAVYRIGYKEGLIAHISGFSIATLSTLLGFPYGIPASLVGAAYANEKLKRGLVSATHFWDADNSNTETDNVNFSLSNTEFSSLCSIGPYPNAFKKAKAYLNGGFIFVNKFVTNNNNLAYGAYFIRYYYEGLINLYKTGKIYCYGMYDVRGREILPKGWVILTDDERKGLVYNILGRIAHLLADMSVPAHVHNDEHGLWEDRYEKKINVEGSDPGFAKYWNADNISGSFIDPYQCTDQIYGLMYGTNQITDQFASNRYNGDKNYLLNGFQGIPEWKTIIDNTVCNSSSANYSDADLTQIRDVTYPYVIRATAGLLFWFATQTCQLQIQLPITVNKTFEFDPSETETVYGYLAQQTNISVPAIYTKNGRQYTFWGWGDGVNLNPRTITLYNNSTYTA